MEKILSMCYLKFFRLNSSRFYKDCSELYEYTKAIYLLGTVKHLAEDAFKKYNRIVTEHLSDESGFDRIEYGV